MFIMLCYVNTADMFCDFEFVILYVIWIQLMSCLIEDSTIDMQAFPWTYVCWVGLENVARYGWCNTIFWKLYGYSPFCNKKPLLDRFFNNCRAMSTLSWTAYIHFEYYCIECKYLQGPAFLMMFWWGFTFTQKRISLK